LRLPRPDNSLIVTILRSPLHPLLSGMVIVLRYRGRRSGRRYTIPVQYVEHDNRFVVAALDADRKQWWRNVLARPEVEVLHRGRWRSARAEVVKGDAALERWYVERFKWASGRLGEETVFVVLHPETADLGHFED
jgi:deazaflavin-dependent oxidoreductase (nitroreductase family)